MIKRSIRSRQYGNWTLIGLLVTLCIIGILAAMYIPRIADPHSQPGQPATPMERAYGAACSEYEAQMNEAVTMYKSANDDRAPSSLSDLKPYGVTDDMIFAPGCHFQIDPTSGTVVETGHGKYEGSAQRGPYQHNPAWTPAAGRRQSPDAAATTGEGNGTVGPGDIKIPNIPTADPGL
ncbi:MAG: type II secretion system protein [Capsulimonadaceae bacterium]